MKILQLVTKRQYRGAEVFAYNLSKGLIEKGHQILFVGLYKHNDEILELQQAKNIDLAERKTRFTSLKTILKLYQLIKKEQPDIIQCNGSDTLKYAYFVSLFTKTPPIVYRNISMISKWINNPLKIFLYRLIFKKVNFVTSVGNYTAADFEKTLKYPKNRISVIRRGIPLINTNPSTARQKLLSELGLKNSDKLVMHAGNFSPEKNHEFLIEVFKRIKEQRNDIKLILAGTGDLWHDIKQKVETAGLSDSIFMLGFRADIQDILSGVDLFVLVSKIEGVPGVILEAAAQKIPAIAIDVGGVSEVIIPNETGILLNNFKPDEFAQNIINLIDNPDLKKQMGEKAYNLFLQNFDQNKTTDQFIKLYKTQEKFNPY